MRPIIPNNVTHDTIKQLITVEQEGISDNGWTIYHERQIIRNICFYGQERVSNVLSNFYNLLILSVTSSLIFPCNFVLESKIKSYVGVPN